MDTAYEQTEIDHILGLNKLIFKIKYITQNAGHVRGFLKIIKFNLATGSDLTETLRFIWLLKLCYI